MRLTQRVVVPLRVSEHNDSVRELQGLQMVQNTNPEMLVFLDESALGGLTGLEANGRSAPNAPAVEKCVLSRLLNELDWAGIEPATICFPGQTLYH